MATAAENLQELDLVPSVPDVQALTQKLQRHKPIPEPEIREWLERLVGFHTVATFALLSLVAADQLGGPEKAKEYLDTEVKPLLARLGFAEPD